jgi:hypothetical protein
MLIDPRLAIGFATAPPRARCVVTERQQTFSSEGDAMERMQPGTPVEVWNDFNQRWTTEFEVAEVQGEALRVRRLSDGHVLPQPFGIDAVRPASRPAD